MLATRWYRCSQWARLALLPGSASDSSIKLLSDSVESMNTILIRILSEELEFFNNSFSCDRDIWTPVDKMSRGTPSMPILTSCPVRNQCNGRRSVESDTLQHLVVWKASSARHSSGIHSKLSVGLIALLEHYRNLRTRRVGTRRALHGSPATTGNIFCEYPKSTVKRSIFLSRLLGLGRSYLRGPGMSRSGFRFPSCPVNRNFE